MEIGIVNGPNLDRLGKREPEVYGHATLADLEASIAAHAKQAGVKTRFFQSNHEGKLIDGTGMKVVEVHISNIYKREEFRHKSVTASACEGVITGLGFPGYLLAVDYLVAQHKPVARAKAKKKAKPAKRK